MFGAEEVELKPFLLKMLNYTSKEREKYMALGGENGDPNLMTKTFLVCYESAYPIMQQNMPGMKESERQMLYHFLSQGAGGVLTWWIRDGMQQSPEFIAQFILGVCSITAEVIQKQDWQTMYQE